MYARRKVRNICSALLFIFITSFLVSAFITSTPAHHRNKLRREPSQVARQVSQDPKVLSERQRHLRRVCEKLGHRRSSVLSPKQLEYIYVDDKRKTMFCLLPKVASTNWLKVLITLQGLDVDQPSEIQGHEVHGTGSLAKKVPTLNAYDKLGIKYRLRKYKKVIFVRHPFERLLSAYNNKFTSTNKYFSERFGDKMIRRYRSGPKNHKDDKPVKSKATFEEFLKYITIPSTRTDSNEHWLQYHRLCLPCAIDYDVIGKQETFNKDVEYVLNMMNVQDVQFPSFHSYSKHKTRESMAQTYRNVSRQTLHDLWFQYRMDFELFGYEKPSFL